MFLPIRPIGVNTPNPDDHMPIWQVINGDDWSLNTRVYIPPALTTPATPDNSRVIFVLAQDRFSKTPIWTARWLDGILEADKVNHPGLIIVRIPDDITSTLRRGAYAFSMTVADSFGRHTVTVLTGTIQVEYEPTSPLHNIPYRRDS
jgi:hypothetical protein